MRKFSTTFFGFLLPITILMTVSCLYINAEKCVTLLNFILTYEKFLNSRQIRSYQKIVKLIVGLLGLVASIVAPIFLIVINILEPERAPSIGSVIKNVVKSRFAYFVGHFAAIILQGWIYAWLAPGFCMAIFNIFIASIFSMLVCLLEIRR